MCVRACVRICLHSALPHTHTTFVQFFSEQTILYILYRFYINECSTKTSICYRRCQFSKLQIRFSTKNFCKHYISIERETYTHTNIIFGGIYDFLRVSLKSVTFHIRVFVAEQYLKKTIVSYYDFLAAKNQNGSASFSCPLTNKCHIRHRWKAISNATLWTTKKLWSDRKRMGKYLYCN